MLAVTVSHLCADGRDGTYLVYQLAQAYRLLLQTGSCGGLQVKNGSRATEQIYAKLSRKEMWVAEEKACHASIGSQP